MSDTWLGLGLEIGLGLGLGLGVRLGLGFLLDERYPQLPPRAACKRKHAVGRAG